MKVQIKNSKGELNPLIPAMLGIMIATVIGMSVVIPTIQGIVTTATTINSATETNVAARNGTTLTLAHGDLESGSFVATVKNGTSGVDATYTSANYTLDLGTGASDLGTVAWAVANNMSVSHANLTYNYYPATYIRNGTVVTLLSLIPLFLVLVILMGAVAFIKF